MQTNKIGINTPKNIYTNNQQSGKQNFKGAGALALNGLNGFFQVCDDVPMIGVSFMDTVSAIAPRTVVDLNQAGIPAAAETMRRESSGLIVNCLIPGAFVLAAGKFANNGWMKDFKKVGDIPINMSRSWANGEAVQNLVGVWKDYAGLNVDIKDLADTVQADAIKKLEETPFEPKKYVKSILNKVEGLNGTDQWKKFSEHGELIDRASEILEPYFSQPSPRKLIDKIKFSHQKNQSIKHAYNLLVTGEHTYKDAFGKTVTEVIEKGGGLKATQNLKFNGKIIGSDLKSLLRDTVDIGDALMSSEYARQNPNYFIKRAKGLINTKSLMGLAIVLPLAMSMQTINRAITRHKYNRSGAPIYKDFENESRVLTDKEKKQLKITKPLAVGSIVGLAALSMGKSFPKSLKGLTEMLQFNTKFPSINQCRLIATATFASRMLASEDPNELRESTVRDLASFAGLYFLGDYAEKLAATGIQKFSKAGRSGELQLFNRTKDPKEYKNVFQKVVGWVKDTKVKSFDEVPQQFKGHRSLAKIGGLGFSIALLGVLLPMYNKHVTNKKEAKRKEILEQQKQHSISYNPKTIFPDKTPTEEEIKKASLIESKKNFKDWSEYSQNSAFSKVASGLIDKN